MVSGFGSIVVDVLMSAHEIELHRKNSVDGQTIQIGGVIPTALVVLSRLGISTRFHSSVGNDLFGDALKKMLTQEHVDIENVTTTTDKTPFAFVIVDPNNAKRTSFYTTGTFSTNSNSAFSLDLDPTTTHLLIDGHNKYISLELIKKAKEKGIVTLLDLGNPKNGLDELVQYADYIIVPQAYWKTLWPEGDPEKIAVDFLHKGPHTVVVTLEEKGCIVAQKEGVFHQSSFPVNAIDTNGAGDVFFGTFTYGLTQNWDIKKTVQFACAAAARSCAIAGKENKIPKTKEEIFEFIEKNNA